MVYPISGEEGLFHPGPKEERSRGRVRICWERIAQGAGSTLYLLQSGKWPRTLKQSTKAPKGQPPESLSSLSLILDWGQKLSIVFHFRLVLGRHPIIILRVVENKLTFSQMVPFPSELSEYLHHVCDISQGYQLYMLCIHLDILKHASIEHI